MFDKKCSTCGRHFVILSPTTYAYVLKRHGRKQYYCSHSCWYADKRKIESGGYKK